MALVDAFLRSVDQAFSQVAGELKQTVLVEENEVSSGITAVLYVRKTLRR